MGLQVAHRRGLIRDVGEIVTCRRPLADVEVQRNAAQYDFAYTAAAVEQPFGQTIRHAPKEAADGRNVPPTATEVHERRLGPRRPIQSFRASFCGKSIDTA